ncbi:DUF6262 family protein [Nakamurella leprariae]|uniref:Transposase n=1 Tax=Nakamurella leprariae TaxID=2803911 RepID=A0A938YF91_9ACTN|nr:DUF6262 family protein [Nakamurella leprariae]MBM9469637.1 hypothetical protein [Nakamurella leprariae]
MSSADRLAAAAADRSARTLQRVHTALAELARAGQPITVVALARHAQVSRSWLYTPPELLADLARTPAPPPPAAAPAEEGTANRACCIDCRWRTPRTGR